MQEYYNEIVISSKYRMFNLKKKTTVFQLLKWMLYRRGAILQNIEVQYTNLSPWKLLSKEVWPFF